MIFGIQQRWKKSVMRELDERDFFQEFTLILFHILFRMMSLWNPISNSFDRFFFLFLTSVRWIFFCNFTLLRFSSHCRICIVSIVLFIKPRSYGSEWQKTRSRIHGPKENDFYSCFINDLEAGRGKAHWFKIRQKSFDFF